MDKEKIEHQPRYGVAVIGIVFMVIMFSVGWYLVMDTSDYSITGKIVEVRYKDNGIASDSVLVFFANHTGEYSSIEFEFDTNTYYNLSNSEGNIGNVYQLLKSHIGDYVTIEYTRSPLGDVGFKNLTVNR